MPKKGFISFYFLALLLVVEAILLQQLSDRKIELDILSNLVQDQRYYLAEKKTIRQLEEQLSQEDFDQEEVIETILNHQYRFQLDLEKREIISFEVLN